MKACYKGCNSLSYPENSPPTCCRRAGDLEGHGQRQFIEPQADFPKEALLSSVKTRNILNKQIPAEA